MNWKRWYQLLDRYQKGRGTPEEKRLMDIWYDSLSEEERLSIPSGQLKEEMWVAIGRRMDKSGSRAERRHLQSAGWRLRFIRVFAAVLLLASGFLGYLVFFAGEQEERGRRYPEPGWTELVNSSGSVREIRLGDGSYVRLDPASSLFAPRQFETGRREVFLSGGGYFRVARDRKRPFYVFTETLVTRVLGTSFTIRKSRDRRATEVLVLTGKVEVRKSAGAPLTSRFEAPVVVTPHRKITVPEEGEAFVTNFPAKPGLSDAAEPAPVEVFVFREKEVGAVLPVFENQYGITIELSDPAVRNCVITADMSQDRSLVARLEILCAAIDADFKIKEDRVYITGAGCFPNN